MFAIVLNYHARSEQYLFDSAESCAAQVAAIEGKIGKKWYGKNGDDEFPTYRFSHLIGEAVICLEKVESIAMHDLTKDESIGAGLIERKIARDIIYKTKHRDAMQAAGLIEAPSADAA